MGRAGCPSCQKEQDLPCLRQAPRSGPGAGVPTTWRKCGGLRDAFRDIIVIHPELLEILRCPDDRSRLREADAGLVERLNQAIAQKGLKNRAGRPVESPLDGALVREDGRYAYPIVDGIPVLLMDEAIPLDQLPAVQ